MVSSQLYFAKNANDCQIPDNLVVVNLSNPDRTAVESTPWEIQLMPNDVFVNITSFFDGTNEPIENAFLHTTQ